MARAKKAAKAHGVPFDRWQQLTDDQREAFNKWHRNNPTKTLDDWFASPRKRGLTTPEAQRRAAERSAQTLGVEVEDWLALTKPEQNAFRVWWLRNFGSLVEFRTRRMGKDPISIWKQNRRGPNKESRQTD